MPEPPARIRSASVPCGVSSTSSSPERYCRANSLFSPTYDDTIRRIRRSSSSRPRPQSSTPQLFETASRSVAPGSSSASISTEGMPHSPKPPTASEAPSPMSATASAALADHLVHGCSPSPCPPAESGETLTPTPHAGRAGPLGPWSRALERRDQGRQRRDETPPRRVADWPRVNLHVVSGKGGTGKTTVAAALALALASRGKQVLLCEVEGRQGIAQLFDVPPLPYEERRIAQGPDDGGDVYALAVDAESAMLEYLALYYRLGAAPAGPSTASASSTSPRRSRPGCATCCSPARSTRRSSATRATRTRGVYDAVVLDAPPTGPDRAVPQRQRRVRRARQGRRRSAARPSGSWGCSSRRAPRSTWSPCWRTCRSRRPPTASRSSSATASRSAASWST